MALRGKLGGLATMRGLRLAAMITALALGSLALGWSQRSRRGEAEALFHDLATNRQPPADTEFNFARIHFNGRYSRRTATGFMFRGVEGWAHDYPEAEEHIMQIASEATLMNVRKEAYAIVELGSDEVYKYPFMYFSEVGEMNLLPEEIVHFREHLNRGGFAMVDDFDGQAQFDWFHGQMKKVFPDRDFVAMDIRHPLFHTFYELPTLDVIPPYETAEPPKFYGYFDDRGRLCMIINLNHDLGDFWEWIDQPMYPLAPSTEGLRFGLNYFLFSLTH